MQGQQFRKVPIGAINAGGNLNFERFADICKVMMVDAATIIADQEYLDNEIVGVRNRIAHGANIVISDERLAKATNFVLSSMRLFRTDIETCVLNRAFGPAYAHPRFVEFRESIPLTATNKPDRRLLVQEAERIAAQRRAGGGRA